MPRQCKAEELVGTACGRFVMHGVRHCACQQGQQARPPTQSGNRRNECITFSTLLNGLKIQPVFIGTWGSNCNGLLVAQRSGLNAFCKWEPAVLLGMQVHGAAQHSIQATLCRTMLTSGTILQHSQPVNFQMIYARRELDMVLQLKAMPR